MVNSATMTIFIAEDNPADVYLLRMALEEAGHSDVRLIVATDGEEALDFVRSGGCLAAEKPDLFVLDLNLPKSDGADVLRSVRESSEYRTTPVVVLTSSDSPRDREEIEHLGASGYLTKPSDLEAFIALGGMLLEYVRPNRRAIAH